MLDHAWKKNPFFRHQRGVFMALAMNYCINTYVFCKSMPQRITQLTEPSYKLLQAFKITPLKLHFEIKFTLIMKHTSRNILLLF